MVAGALLAGCRPTADRPPAAAADSAAQPAGPADSLVLRVNDSTAVWFTASRPAADSAGRPCVERTVEIRTGSRRQLVPLLYTAQAPTVRDDSTLEAMLWKDCAPMARYRVHLRTGLPTPIR